MSEHERTEDMTQVAEVFSGAVERFVESVNRLEQITPKPGLPDHDADSYALSAVHRARAEIGRTSDTSAPTPKEVERWVIDREERRQFEGS